MAYRAYVDKDYYKNEYGGDAGIEDSLLERMLKQASRHIDALTFNRIVAKGFDNLTQYQQDIIKEVVCKQADFVMENADVMDTILQSYSINGVSMQFGGKSWNVHVDKGIAIRKDVYALLGQTGLTCRLLGV